MPIINLRFYIYAALFVGAIAFFMRYDYLSDKVKKQALEITQYEVNAGIVAQQIKNAESARIEYLNQIEASKNEIDTLRNSVNAGATGLRIKASCPKMPTVTDYTARTEPASPELDEDARQDYYSLREGIKTVEARYHLCIKTLKDERK